MRCIEDWCKEDAAKNQSFCADHAKVRERIKPCRTCGGPLVVDGRNCKSCYRKAKAAAGGTSISTKAPGADDRLSATQIGTQLGLKGYGVNEVFVELGWLDDDRNVTALGTRMGAVIKTSKRGDFALWPVAIIENKFFKAAVKRLTEGERAPELMKDAASGAGSGAGSHVADDGHYVRSKAALRIDNWLYSRGLLHAYERLIPGQDELKCDFHLPAGNIFIEFWGLTGEPFATRKKRKQAFYADHGLRLIELEPQHLKTLDETLSQALRRFGVKLAG
ncbi:MAG: hypothetical protein JNM17_30295 [Archangium sp.]|nr:hypothetical protein [Archangium sp.]